MRNPGRAVTLALTTTLLAGWGRCESGPADAGACGERPTGAWRLVWSDEFEGPANQLPDPSKWTFDVGGSGWGNNQLEFDTDRPENVSLDGQGRLRITAIKEAQPYQGRDYTSGRIKTQGRFARAYGRFEARIQLPVGRGIWPAFWMLGADFPTVGWPACGEIDVMEYRGQQPSRSTATVHGPGYSGGAGVGSAYDLPGGARFDQGFHTFAVEWDPCWLVFSVDGTEFHAVIPSSIPRDAPWVFDDPFFILLNLAVGGNYVGPPDGTTVFPQTMLVDWVRVYERVTP